MQLKFVIYFLESILMLMVYVYAQNSNPNLDNERIQRLIEDTVDPRETSYATSHARLVRLMIEEKSLVNNLNTYVNAMQEKVDLMRLAVSDLEAEHAKAGTDAEEYLGNPLNGFSLMRRMNKDWPIWQKYMNETVGQAHINFMENLSFQLPTKGDFNESIRGLQRILATHELKAEDMVNGILDGVQYDARMSAIDCYLVAQISYDATEYADAEIWYRLALKLYNPNMAKIYTFYNMKSATIWHEISKTLHKRHLIKEAIEASAEAEKLEPENKFYRDYRRNLQAFVNMQQGCRGEFKTPTRLHCFLIQNTPFLNLAPIKIEQVDKDQLIFLFHDVLYDSEIDALKELTTRRLLEGNNATGELVDAHTVALRPYSGTVLKTIFQRIGHMVNTNPREADTLYVAQLLPVMVSLYYEDFLDAKLSPISLNKIRNSFESITFFLNEVEAGGAIVFPFAKVTIIPRKGSALVAIHKTAHGKIHQDTVFTSCPIISGYKWTAVKYITNI